MLAICVTCCICTVWHFTLDTDGYFTSLATSYLRRNDLRLEFEHDLVILLSCDFASQEEAYTYLSKVDELLRCYNGYDYIAHTPKPNCFPILSVPM